MTDARFTLKNTEDTGQAEIAGLTWEAALEHLGASPDANIDYALDSMSFQRSYSFHNDAGQIMRLTREA